MTAPMEPRALGRYLFYAPIASGGMATVYLGRMAGPKGFSRIIAIKQLHARLVHDTDFVAMFLDEAQLIGRIHHSNVVAPIDVVEADGDLCIVMEYVHGEALRRLMKLSRQDRMPLRVVSAIMVQTLLGLHAAHEVTDSDGLPLSIVHRDVSPQNILVGEDGITRVVDFGIAKAANVTRQSDVGKLKGKLGYMAPEQLMAGPLDRRCDIFAAGIILWEMLTGKKLLHAESPMDAIERMSRFEPKAPSSIVPSLAPELDAIAQKALARNPDDRFASAHEMARALEAACQPAGAIEVAEWVTRLVGDTLSIRAKWIADLIAIDMGEFTQSYVMTSSLPPATAAKSAPPEPDPAPPAVARGATPSAPSVAAPEAMPDAPTADSRDATTEERAQIANDTAPKGSAAPVVVLPASPVLDSTMPQLSAAKVDGHEHAAPPTAGTLPTASEPAESTASIAGSEAPTPEVSKSSQSATVRSLDRQPRQRGLRAQQSRALTGGVVLLVCAALVWLSWRRSQSRTAPTAAVALAASPSSAASHAVSEVLLGEPTAIATAPGNSDAGAPPRGVKQAPSPSPPRLPAPREATHAPASATQLRHGPRPTASSTQPPSDCKVPYYYDSKHIKRYKLECFKKH